MSISEWLDKKDSEGVDVSHIRVPDDLAYDEVPDETIYFKQIRPCGILCPGNHPFPLSSDSDTGTIAGGKTRRQAFIPQT
jgi:hypothetical protein